MIFQKNSVILFRNLKLFSGINSKVNRDKRGEEWIKDGKG